MNRKKGSVIPNRKTQLQSLIDMAFILLIFFLVTSVLKSSGSGEQQKMAIPTPKNQAGQAQIVIQIINPNQYMFLGDSARKMAEQILVLPLSESMKKSEIVSRLSNFVVDQASLIDQISKLKVEAVANPKNEYFVLIRCPDEVPYSHVMDIIEGLSGIANIQYGCVGGVVDRIYNPNRITLQEVPDKGGVRKNIVFEF